MVATRLPHRPARQLYVTSEDVLSIADVYQVLQGLGRPVATTAEIAARLDLDESLVLAHLEAADDIDGRAVSDETIWFPTSWESRFDQEHVICFPDTRELVVDQPSQFTRAQLSQFATLEATTGDGGYRYRIRPVDIWHAPYEDLDALERTIRDVLPTPQPSLMEWIRDHWRRARQFTLETHEDGYTVLRAGAASLMANVAREELDDHQLRAPISETESWVAEGEEASIKRILFEAGFPVQDRRVFETGEPLDIDLSVTLRDYQESWIESFMEHGSGVLVGPPGSGKTVAALGILAHIGGEALILVPGRELAGQWRDRILNDTTLTPDQVGEYHGGTKQLRPITIATYHIASMDRHRTLFDERNWGAIVFDEVHHIPASVYRRTSDLQSRYRLGLSASPVRGDEKEDEIFVLIGPPIGTDWAALIEAGHVIEPELEIRYVPWGSENASAAYAAASGYERRQVAAMNPEKCHDIDRLRARHPDDHILIFVDWLEQGKELADWLDVPFVSGETPHSRRERYFEAFRSGRLDTLVISRVGDEGIDLPDASVAILASGLGGSRRQGTQRAGRTMRPVGGATVYVLATQGTEEEDFASQQLRYLQRKGIRVHETVIDPSEE